MCHLPIEIPLPGNCFPLIWESSKFVIPVFSPTHESVQKVKTEMTVRQTEPNPMEATIEGLGDPEDEELGDYPLDTMMIRSEKSYSV